MRLSGYGEILPHPDNRVRLNRDVQDGYGLPTLTFDARLRENELAMRRDMQVAAAEMLEAAGAGLAAGPAEMGRALASAVAQRRSKGEATPRLASTRSTQVSPGCPGTVATASRGAAAPSGSAAPRDAPVRLAACV